MALWTGWTREQLQAGIANLREAIAGGALRVRFADRDVTYQSQGDLERTLSGMVAELERIDNPVSARPRTRIVNVRDRSGW